MADNLLHWADYVIFACFLLTSISIGVYFAVSGGQQRTTQEFLLGNRQLKVLPTMLSLLVSYQSAIAILGFTAELYTKGSMQWLWMHVCIFTALGLAERVFIPWIYPLGLTSVYEYLELRFRSKTVRIVGAALGILYAILYMGAALYAPSVALEAATGFPTAVSIPLMAVVCVIYTSLGGIKAVVWTDVFQWIIMMIGILGVIIKGSMEVKGVPRALGIAKDQGRLIWADISPDPTVRHTVWGFLFGFSLNWGFTYGLQQASVQRYSAVPSLRDARLTVLLNIPVLVLMGTISSLNGVLALAYYWDQGCDPLASGQIGSANQILASFVVKIFAQNRGFAGLFLATLYSGALSSVSSSLAGAAANSWEDILKWKLHISEYRAAVLNKILVVIFGAIGIGFAFLAQGISAPIIEVTLLFLGAVSGPLGGMFIMGGVRLLRKAEWRGVTVGGLAGIAFNIWIGAGSMTLDNPHSSLPPLPTDRCVPPLNYTTPPTEPITGFSRLYKLSYLWYVLTGFLVSISVGMCISLIVRAVCKPEIDDNVQDELFIDFRQVFTFSNFRHPDDLDEKSEDREEVVPEEQPDVPRSTKAFYLNPAYVSETSVIPDCGSLGGSTLNGSIRSTLNGYLHRPPIVEKETHI